MTLKKIVIVFMPIIKRETLMEGARVRSFLHEFNFMDFNVDQHF